MVTSSILLLHSVPKERTKGTDRKLAKLPHYDLDHRAFSNPSFQ